MISPASRAVRYALLLTAVIAPLSEARAFFDAQVESRATSSRVPIIDARQALQLAADGALLVDVREPAEVKETGKLRGAINLPLSALKLLPSTGGLPPELLSYKRRPVIFYCRSGRRAAEASEIVLTLGMTKVYNLGGFDDAVRGGFPLTR